MVTGSKAMSAGQASSYFDKDNYYIKDGITEAGKWHGKTAEELGLKGDVTQKEFVELLNGYKPGSLTDGEIKQLEELNKIESKLREEASAMLNFEKAGANETTKSLTITDFLEGDLVSPSDRGNLGEVIGINEETGEISVRFINKETDRSAEKIFKVDNLKNLTNLANKSNDEKSAIKDLQARIAAYNIDRLDFHKDVKTGGLHSQIKELKAMGSKDPEIQKQIRKLEKDMKDLSANDFRIGDKVSPSDRENFGEVIGFDSKNDRVKIKFTNPETGKSAEKFFSRDELTNYSTREENTSEEAGRPRDNQQLIRDGRDEYGIATHRAGFDFTMSAPKSVSIMALVAGDDKLVQAHHEATAKAMEYMESQFAQTRDYNEARVRERVNTGNLASAQFTHYTSRATSKDAIPDPQLHSHNLILNMTKNGDKWMSLEPQQLFAAQKLAGQIYQNELARGVKEAGYGVEWDKSGGNYTFEIKGVDKELRDGFSSRTGQIEAIVAAKEKELGRSLSAEEKNNITLDSRAHKSEQNIDDLKKDWDESLREMGHTKESLIDATKNQNNDKTIATDATEAVKMAVDNLHSRKAVFSEHEITREALKAAQGSASLEAVRAALKENAKELLIENTDTYAVGVDKNNSETVLYSSKRILRAEANIEKAVAGGKNTGSIMIKEEFANAYERIEVKKIAEAEESGKKYFSLTEGQRWALEHIATSPDRYIGIQGDAGSGKTTALERMAKVAEILKDTVGDNVELIGLAPTNIAAGNIQADAGIQSRTVDSFINKPTEAQEGKQQIYLVDESSMLDTVKMEKLINIAEKTGAKVVFIGDTKQLKPVGAGAMFDRLQKTGQMEFAQVTEVLRQKDGTVAKSVVEAFKNIETLGKGLDQLQNADRLIEAGKDGDINPVREAFANNSAKDYAEHGMNSTIALVSTNEDRHSFNEQIREKLVEAGIVSDDGKKHETLQAKRLDNIDTKFAGNYSVGNVLVSNKFQGGRGAIKNGTRTTVTAINRETNEIKLSFKTQGRQEKERWISADNASSFSPFEKAEKKFAIGDKIAFEQKDKTIGVENGETGVIKSIDENGLWQVERGGEMISVDPEKYPFVSYAYAMTVHKSQGQSIDRVHVFADSSKGGLSTNAGYVQMSRAKEELTVYTDNRSNLEKQYIREQIAENAGERVDTAKFAETPAEPYDLNNPAGVKAPEMQKIDKSMTREDIREMALVDAAKREQKNITSNIEEMRNDAKVYSDKASHHLKESRNIKQTARTRSEHMYEVGRAGTIAKDIKGGIRYQQLVKTEAKMMEKCEIDLRAERNFVLRQPGGTKEVDAGYLAGQARSQAMMNQMVKDGILIRDLQNNERYELAVSRQEYAAYRKSEKAHETKADLAQGAWNRAIGDKLFEQGRANADAAMIAGGGWNPREAINKVKSQGLHNKDTEEIFNRLTARYERLCEEGLVRKVGGEYKAVDKGAMKSYVGSRDDRLMSYRGEGENVEQYREMKKLKESTSGIIQGGMKQIDKSIMKSTHVNRETVKQDITDAYKGTEYVFNAQGIFGHVAAGAVGMIIGTVKTVGRGIAGAVYRMTKEVVKDATEAVKDTLDIKMDKEVDTEKAVDLMTRDERLEQFQQKLNATAGKDKYGEKPELIKEKEEKEVDTEKSVDLEKINKEIEEMTGQSKSEDGEKELAEKGEKDKDPEKSFEERLEEAAGGRSLDDKDGKEATEKEELAERNEEEERNSGGDESALEKEEEKEL